MCIASYERHEESSCLPQCEVLSDALIFMVGQPYTVAFCHRYHHLAHHQFKVN